MTMLLDVGIAAISARLLELRAALLEGMRPRGYRLYIEDDAPPSPETQSAILSFTHPSKDLGGVHRELESKGIVTSCRKDRDGESLLRISPHFYNTEQEIDRLVELLR